MGSCYVAVAGILKKTNDHAHRAAEFAFDLLDEAALAREPSNIDMIKVGLHH
jgi:hypothetical protein